MTTEQKIKEDKERELEKETRKVRWATKGMERDMANGMEPIDALINNPLT